LIRYLLDTDILSYLMRRRFPALNARFDLVAPEDIAISAVTAAEILFGLKTFAPEHPMHMRALRFLDAIQILDWPAEAAAVYADIRFHTKQQPLGERDMMIAAHAIALEATLVTNNTRHFGRIGESLRLENWLW
jgi:tRNA(fMet)-specific endonuclease VapC